MLSPDEFTVGAIGDAEPLSLVMPRGRYEEMVLIGQTANGPAGVFLSGQFRFLWLNSKNNQAWKGVIIPNVDIEVDLASLCDPGFGRQVGSLVRTGTIIGVHAREERQGGPITNVTLRTGLASAGEEAAWFSKWRVVTAVSREVLVEIDVDAET